MIEQDISRIAAALERIAEINAMVIDAAMLSHQPRIVLRTSPDAPQPEHEPQEFVKPGPGPGRGKKKPKPEVLEENPTQEDATAPAAEVPNTAPETDTSPASHSEPEITTAPNPTVIPEVTLEDVSRAVVEMAKVKTRDEIMAVWKPFGINRGSELKPEQFFDALMAIKEAMRA